MVDKGGHSSNQNKGGSYIPDVLEESQFSGYLGSDKSGCLRRCQEMLAAVGCELSGKDIIMTGYDGNGRTTNSKNTSLGIEYIDSQLKKGRPVVVAVDYKVGTSMGEDRKDQAGDHFVVIVGGDSSNGYHYYDPATANIDRGTSVSNTFTLKDGKLTDVNECTGKSTNYYTVTSIRENM